MEITFKIIKKEHINSVVPLVQKLNENKISSKILEQRFSEMVHQNYECAGVFDGETLIGVTGLWFCTRHYSGKSIEIDHVFLEESYRSKGIGKQFMEWIFNYIGLKGYESVELNTYVQNHASHKFYYNHGFKILGYHFVKKM
ncbi:GNAT family N-acetyltransferase [Flavobacteriales bacterium 34_180_T64]|nr:GNAT family N-acetyltransferase [Flavobacteriales bacterium 34_180_T64]